MNQQLIFDIGLHQGQDTGYYLSKGYRVLAIEANPVLASFCSRKFQRYVSSGQLIIENVGIAAKPGKMPFYINKRLSEWSSFDKSLGTRNGSAYEIQEVACVTTAGLFDTYGIPYYLKVDIEGFDFYCINDLPDNGQGPKYVSCEATEVGLIDTMYEKGYRKFKLIHQSNGFKAISLEKEKKVAYLQWLKIRNGLFLRLNRYISFTHNYGSSGPFGEETDGAWLSYAHARNLFLEFYQFEKNKPINDTSWFDFHATY